MSRDPGAGWRDRAERGPARAASRVRRAWVNSGGWKSPTESIGDNRRPIGNCTSESAGASLPPAWRVGWTRSDGRLVDRGAPSIRGATYREAVSFSPVLTGGLETPAILGAGGVAEWSRPPVRGCPVRGTQWM
jgi:hypothetical protein